MESPYPGTSATMPEGQVMVSTQPTVPRKPNVSAQTELQLQIDRHQRDLHLNRSQYHGACVSARL